jgi:hypothetical protein
MAVRALAITALIVLGASAVSAQTGIQLIQHTSKDAGSVASSTLAFASGNGTGNWIGVVVRGGVSGETFTVSDSKGNAYQQAVRLDVTMDPPAGDTLAIYYAENIKSGANSVTVAGSSVTTLRFAILEYAGVTLGSSLDVTASAQGTSAAASSGSATTTAAGELLLGAVAAGDGVTFTAGAGYQV